MIDAIKSLKSNRNMLHTAELPEKDNRDLWKAIYYGMVETMAESLTDIEQLLSLKSTKKERALAMGYIADIRKDYERITAGYWNSAAGKNELKGVNADASIEG